MSQRVDFCFVSSAREDRKRIIVSVKQYPFKPNVGDQVSVPISPDGHPSRLIYGVISEVTHNPMSQYFRGDQETAIDCTVNHSLGDFDDVYKWLTERKSSIGLTHQWANWDVREI